MARTLIPITVVTHDGVNYPAATNSDPTNEHEVEDNDATIILIMENTSASIRTVVVECAASFGDPAIPLVDRTISLAATGSPGDKQVAGAFSRRLFNQTGDAGAQSILVDVDGSASDVEFVALSVPIPVS